MKQTKKLWGRATPRGSISASLSLDGKGIGKIIWRDGAVVKLTCCCYGGPEFGFQHPHGHT